MSLESCDACGKANEGLKACNACKLVKYCNIECQVAHRPKHRRACKRTAAELFEQKLFAEPPRRNDCPICMLTMPLSNECAYMLCCGKMICLGCYLCLTRRYCPFCNTPTHRSDDEAKNRLLKRIEKYNDPEAMNMLATDYTVEESGSCLDDYKEAVALYHRAGELGSAVAHLNLGNWYRGVELDKKKASHHYQVSAILGNESARHILGEIARNDGNTEHAMRHFMISVKSGLDTSLEEVKRGFVEGLVTKDDFESTLRGHQASKDETNSDQRDRAKDVC